MIYAVYKIDWTEYERWGCRPDGVSLYSDYKLAWKHVKEHADNQPKDHVPHCYTKPSEPELVEVTKEVLDRILEKEKEGKVYWGK